MGRYWSPKRLYLPLLRPSKHSWDKHAPVVTSKFALQLCSWGWIRHLTPLQIWLILDCIYYPALSRSARCELLKFPPLSQAVSMTNSQQGRSRALPFHFLSWDRQGQIPGTQFWQQCNLLHCYCSIYCCSLTNSMTWCFLLPFTYLYVYEQWGRLWLRLPYWRYKGNR